jgi:hypothetical protein
MQPKVPFSPYDDDFIPRSVVPEDDFGNAPNVDWLNSKSNLDKMKAIMDEIARLNVKDQPKPNYDGPVYMPPNYVPDLTDPVPNKPNYDDKGFDPDFQFPSQPMPSMQPQAPTGTGNAPYNPYASMGGGINPPMGGIGSLSGGIGGLGGNYQNNTSGAMPAQNNMLGQSTNTPVKPPNPMGMKKGGAVKKFAKGGAIKKSKSSKPMVSNASKRGDGIAQRGKTKGRIV